jgi:hypothetical protein
MADGAGVSKNAEHLAPESASLSCKSGHCSCAGNVLAGKASCEHADGEGHARPLKSEREASDAGEEVNVAVSHK